MEKERTKIADLCRLLEARVACMTANVMAVIDNTDDEGRKQAIMAAVLGKLSAMMNDTSTQTG